MKRSLVFVRCSFCRVGFMVDNTDSVQRAHEGRNWLCAVCHNIPTEKRSEIELSERQEQESSGRGVHHPRGLWHMSRMTEDGWTREQVSELLAVGDWLIVEHSDFPGKPLEVRAMRGENFAAYFECVDEIAGVFPWGTFTVVGFCCIPWKHEEAPLN